MPWISGAWEAHADMANGLCLGFQLGSVLITPSQSQRPPALELQTAELGYEQA